MKPLTFKTPKNDRVNKHRAGDKNIFVMFDGRYENLIAAEHIVPVADSLPVFLSEEVTLTIDESKATALALLRTVLYYHEETDDLSNLEEHAELAEIINQLEAIFRLGALIKDGEVVIDSNGSLTGINDIVESLIYQAEEE
jgi:hypothetical protein